MEQTIGMLTRRLFARTLICLVATWLLVGCGGGGGGESAPTGCSRDPIALPASLPIVDDDAQWLCGALPEPARVDDNLGFDLSGARSCLAGSRPAVSGNDIYVAPEGADSASGASSTEALATLQEALCRALPGQTIHMAPGTYRGAAAVVGIGASASEEVVIRGEGAEPGDTVLDGEFWRSAAITLGESYNVRIENLTVTHYIDAGIQTQLGAKITVQNIVSRSNGRCSVNADSAGEGFGINLVGTKDVRVADSLFEDNGPLLRPVLCGEVLGTGINTFEVSGTISGNTIRSTRGGAMLLEDSGPALVENNIAEGNFLLAVDNYRGRRRLDRREPRHPGTWQHLPRQLGRRGNPRVRRGAGVPRPLQEHHHHRQHHHGSFGWRPRLGLRRMPATFGRHHEFRNAGGRQHSCGQPVRGRGLSGALRP